MFSFEFCEIFKNTFFFIEHLRWPLLYLCCCPVKRQSATVKIYGKTRCLKSVCILGFSGSYFPALGQNTKIYRLSSQNTGKYGPEKLFIWLLFMQERYSFKILLIPIAALGNCFRDRCLVKGVLKKGSYLTSKNGKLKLILQKNGNLEILCGDYSVWSSKTYSTNIEELHFNSGGKLIIFNKDKSVAKRIMSPWDDTYGAEKLVLQDYGNLVIYNHNNQPLWSTGTNGKCVTSKN